ncbi:MAG: DUF4168 domain-containing protein [Leptolyngbyaceae cyanobacterium bins.349]|nr:DUF4168 domain-containing protein [Leptolyngbyaceae cyanobacterium bins.349]
MMNRSIFRFDQFFRAYRLPILAMVGAVSALGVVSVGLADGAYAQVTPADMALYTDIARKIERQRMKDYAEVKQLMGGNVPENVCQQGGLSAQVRKVCDRFDSTSRDIITDSGMSVAKFNEITRYCLQSPKPKECPR